MDGIKSKERVKEHGEVFTPDSIVNDMLDLIDNELKEENLTPEQYTLESCLEPACGNGNFLIRILDRKLAAVRLMEKENQEAGLIKAVSSIYGIDIQEDNVIESRERMMKLIKEGKVDLLELKDKEIKGFYNGGPFEMSPETENIVKFILDKNIVLGNALETDVAKAVQFINWKFDGDMVQPVLFYMTDVDTEHDLDNPKTHYRFITGLNYNYSDEIDEEF